MFPIYFQLGLEHITDLNGSDHILFLVALCAIWEARDWKRVLVLVTAFTVGHSLTLALAAFQVLLVPGDLIEQIIPVTILLTALLNLFQGPAPSSGHGKIISPKLMGHYVLALGFGLIHGLAFSNFFRHLVGQESEIVTPLLQFNLGVEVGQVIIVGVFLGLNALVVGALNLSQKIWSVFFSILAIILTVFLLIL